MTRAQLRMKTPHADDATNDPSLRAQDADLAGRLVSVERELQDCLVQLGEQREHIAELCHALARVRRATWGSASRSLPAWFLRSPLRTNYEQLRSLHFQRKLGYRVLASGLLRMLCNRHPYGYKEVVPLRVCFLGDGFAGSWQMRAEQIACTRPEWSARGIGPMTAKDIARHEIYVFVKRFDNELATRLRRRGRIVVYDIVDPWKQPDDGLNHPTLPEVLDYFRRMLTDLPVNGVIFPNKTMYDDLHDITPNPITIYHHARPELIPAPVRAVPRTVGYEGCVKFLGEWQEIAIDTCQRLGLEFIINPRRVTDVDIGFIARGGPHGSLMAKRYKSNVKLANMLAAGVPTVVQAGEAAYAETGTGLVEFFSTPAELETALRNLLPFSVRCELREKMILRSLRFGIDTIAQEYEVYFRELAYPQRISLPRTIQTLQAVA